MKKVITVGVLTFGLGLTLAPTTNQAQTNQSAAAFPFAVGDDIFLEVKTDQICQVRAIRGNFVRCASQLDATGQLWVNMQQVRQVLVPGPVKR